jgi:hypothetical protein
MNENVVFRCLFFLLAGHVACKRESRVACRGLVGTPEGRRALGRPRPKWEDNIKMDRGEVGWGHELDRYCLGQGQVAGFCERGNEP